MILRMEPTTSSRRLGWMSSTAHPPFHPSIFAMISLSHQREATSDDYRFLAQQRTTEIDHNPLQPVGNTIGCVMLPCSTRLPLLELPRLSSPHVS
jgi:hypothetical protein